LLDVAHQPIHLLLEPAEPGFKIARWSSGDAFLVVGLPAAAALAVHVAAVSHKVACSANHIADRSFSIGQSIAQCFEPATNVLGVSAAIN
jgi:hypothetical protein